LLLCFAMGFSAIASVAAPIPYSGKVAINGANFQGDARFTFALRDAHGTVHWRNGTDANASINVPVDRGLYVVLLGGQGMSPIPSNLFLDHSELYLDVKFYRADTQQWLHMLPDQRITSAPHALAADVANLANLAKAVLPGAITKSMLAADVLADLNATVVLPEQNATIQTGSITRSMLAPGVLSDLNATIAPGSITAGQLAPALLADLNRSVVITRSMLPASVLADLNRTLSRTDLPADVLADLNRTIVITRDMLPGDVLDDLNKTITRNMLPADVLSDLNRTVTKAMLGQDVLADLNRTVTATDIAANTITTAQLNESILKYLRPEITSSPQAPGLVFGGQSVTLASQAEGKYLTYQWNRNGQPVAGATGATLVIADVNGTLHDGNYTLVVSNDFGSVTSSPTGLQVDATPTNHSVASIGMQMIFCPPGTFTMGSPTSEAGRGVETQHSVTLTNGFYLGKYELTQAQYETVMNGNSEGLNAKPSQWPNNDDRPVERVSWNDAQVFLSRLNSIEQTAGRLPNGWKYVLPTEAEWEYACRAGTTTAYSWGNVISPTDANWNHGNDANQTVNVGQYAANPWGFFDMHGNVFEWVLDWKANYPNGAFTNPEGPATGLERILRGGNHSGWVTHLRSAFRHNKTVGFRGDSNGFRVGFKAISPDDANPELELFGGAGITREAGQPWAEPGVAAHDARDGNLTSAVTISGTVDVNSTGTYLLTYSVSDAAGNEVNATRTVTVSDTTDPVVTLPGDANVTHAKDVAWVEPGATAYDTLDGNLTNQVTITGAVDVNSTGAYVLTYSVSDAAGNDSNVTRVVNVGMATTHTVQGASNLQMLWVEPGTFTMGSPTSEVGRLADREDEHNVTFTKGFYLGKYEVTQAQYEAVMTGNTNSLSATPSNWPNNPNRPVEKVSWNDVQVFLTRLNAAEQAAGRLPAGWSYALPTESEWEYACRAGTTTVFAFGNSLSSTQANFDGTQPYGGGVAGTKYGSTKDVGSYAANPWGFFDMHGNVYEWVADWYGAYPVGPLTDPTGTASGSNRVIRDGSWNNPGHVLRSAGRNYNTVGIRYNFIGFRVGFKASQ
jgi:formylglycine-generating enzyme required for sulfatase activity